MEKETYKQMMEQVFPSEALIDKTKRRMIKEDPILVRKTFQSVLVAAAVILAITVTAFAAWFFLRPSEVAEQFGDDALSAAFESDTAVNINESVAVGDYIFTLIAVVNGKDITDMPYYSNNVQDERMYAVVAIQNADGTPMPDTSDDAYGKVDFFASPLVKGLQPWMYNIITMNGAYSSTVVDGVMYRIAECDSVTMFADRGVYFVVSDTTFYSGDAISYNEETGEITVNPDYKGACAIFDLPIDKSLADPVKAEQYIAGLLNEEPSVDIEDVPSAKDSNNVNWDNAEPVASTVSKITADEDGFISYSWDTDEYGGGTVGAYYDECFTDAQEPQSLIINIMQSKSSDGLLRHYAIRFTKDEDGIITGMVVVPKE